MPKELWCPVCGIHNRSMDCYGLSDEIPSILLPMCPVCKDVQKKKEEDMPDDLQE